jgi:hypothetical protein
MNTLKHLRETPWETRNLGVPSYALATGFWDDPDFADLEREMSALVGVHGALFVAARLDRDRLHLVPQLQPLGFYVVECTLSPVMALHRNPVLLDFQNDPLPFIPGRYQREELEFQTLGAMTAEWAETLTAMARESFTDDRFHRDYRCPREIADRRFAYWMNDLLHDAAIAYEVLLLRGSPIAFVAHRQNHMIISGFARRHASSGLGEFFWLSICATAKAAGHRSIHTLISCNNLPSLNLCARCGFRFKDTGYSFHFWENPPRAGA